MTNLKLYFVAVFTLVLLPNFSHAQAVDFEQLEKCYQGLSHPLPKKSFIGTPANSHFIKSDGVQALVIQNPSPNQQSAITVIQKRPAKEVNEDSFSFRVKNKIKRELGIKTERLSEFVVQQQVLRQRRITNHNCSSTMNSITLSGQPSSS